MRSLDHVVIEPLLLSDALGLLQACALDATVFPHPSLPFMACGQAPSIWLARASDDASSSQRVIGFAATAARLRDELELIGVAVDLDWRNVGVARRLVRAVTAVAIGRKFRWLSLHVSTGNAAAVHLYETEGFARAEHLARYYAARSFPDGGSAWWMTKKLR